LTFKHFEMGYKTLNVDAHLEIGKGLPLVSVCLLLTMLGLEEKEIPQYNFELVYSEFHERVQVFDQQAYPKVLCLKAFETLMNLGLIEWIQKNWRQIQFHPVCLVCSRQQVGVMLAKRDKTPEWINQWFGR